MCTQETNRVHEKLPIIFGGPGPLAVRPTGENPNEKGNSLATVPS